MMTKAEVRKLAEDLMEKHGLLKSEGWKFDFSKTYRSLGRCSSKRKEIHISEKWLSVLSYEDVYETLVHEIAHGIVGTDQGHNEVWKAKCRELGISDERLYKNYNQKAPHKFVGVCPNCKSKLFRHRKPTSLISCGVCAPKVFDTDYLFVWQDNPNYVK